MTELCGKTALVTGAAQGIGAATAHTISRAGAKVIGADIQNPNSWLSPSLSDSIQCDVSDERDVEDLFETVNSRAGELDFVINAAGILSAAKISDLTTAEFDRIVNVNLRGSFLIARGAARRMQMQGYGRIILIASELAYLGRAEFSAYCASKAGVVGLVRALAREVAPEVQVNCVAPGPVDTPMLSSKNISQDWIDRECDLPLKRMGRAEEIGGVIRFLCGPDAGFFTGQTVSPNGGAVMI